MTDPSLAPLTETITIGADSFGLVAHGWNGQHRVVLARSFGSGTPIVHREGAGLRECYGTDIDARDVLDLLADGRCGEFAVDRRPAKPATSRRDVDFRA
jgi:hypothetical protein